MCDTVIPITSHRRHFGGCWGVFWLSSSFKRYGMYHTHVPISSLSRMPVNFAEELGGALFNAGLMAINDTVFTENAAGEGGLAIQSMESSVVPRNVTFKGNTFRCPSQQFSHEQEVSMVLRAEFRSDVPATTDGRLNVAIVSAALYTHGNMCKTCPSAPYGWRLLDD